MKKTTIYIDDQNYDELKTWAFMDCCSVSELIREGIDLVCRKRTAQKKGLKLLKELENVNDGADFDEVMNLINEARDEVRAEKRNKK